MIVMKFGGTSLESSEALARMATIVEARCDQRPMVVVSAFGKTTNRLLQAAAHARQGEQQAALADVEWLGDLHRECAQAIPESRRSTADTTIDEHLDALRDLLRGIAALGELTPRSVDAIASFGERLSSALVALLLDGTHLDARRLIVTDDRFHSAAPLYGETLPRLRLAIEQAPSTAVMGGFIGATREGVTTTLGRGGSDFSAAIAGAAIGAQEVQIWTDVDGMLTGDPRILTSVHRVKAISFEEAAELAYFGAKVLHPATLLPAIENDIPLRILNSRRPEVEGTWITSSRVPCTNPIKSIACKRGITLVTISSTRMLMAAGFLCRIFEAFARHETVVDMVTTAEVSVSLTIDDSRNLDAITAALREFADVTVHPGQAIVCLVGDDIRNTPGIAGRAFGAISNLNVRMISQGASLLNLSLVVAEPDLALCVSALHSEFFKTLDPAVFD